jgi:hypothetical protein
MHLRRVRGESPVRSLLSISRRSFLIVRQNGHKEGAVSTGRQILPRANLSLQRLTRSGVDAVARVSIATRREPAVSDTHNPERHGLGRVSHIMTGQVGLYLWTNDRRIGGMALRTLRVPTPSSATERRPPAGPPTRRYGRISRPKQAEC